jgi:hypothetical protein
MKLLIIKKKQLENKIKNKIKNDFFIGNNLKWKNKGNKNWFSFYSV